MTAVTAGRAVRLRHAAPGSARWHRPALAVLLAATATLYLIGLSRNGWANDFYSAAVQAGTKSWKAFFFGSFDASSFITVDKTPASLWVMELSARLFGLNYWSLLVPQALAGVASVAVLYAAVRRWFGPAAGLLAGAILAVTPVAALMFRFNNPDALLVLLMTAAAYATVRAVESGRTRWLLLAGTLLGFGFLTKMLQAFLVLPAFGLAYLIAGPPRLGRRCWQLLAGLGALIVAAGWWVAAVMLTPAADRPYVGGSTNDSILQLAFGYNGLGRLDGNETGSAGLRHGGAGGASFSGSAGLGRLFGADMGGQISWLLPAALLAIGALGWLAWRARARRPAATELRTDPTIASVLIWGGWLIVTGAVFSYMAGIIHPYYTIALAPPIGALVGIGATRLWQQRSGWPARSALGAGVAVTAVWSVRLLDRSPTWLPWLRPVVLAAGIGAAVALLAAPWLAARAGTARARLAVAAATVTLAVGAAMAGPIAYSLDTAASSHAGALPSAGPAVTSAFGGAGGGPGTASAGGGAGGPGASGGSGVAGAAAGGSAAGGRTRPAGSSGQNTPARSSSGSASGSGLGGQPGGFPGGRISGGRSSGGRTQAGRLPAAGSPGAGGAIGGSGSSGGPGGLGGSTQVATALSRLLSQDASKYTWAAATVGSESAAPLQLATRDPIMAIGGFNGSDPAPTLAEFERLVAEHKIHYFVGTNADSFGGGSGGAQAITKWVRAHFRAQEVGGETVYNLTEPTAG